jgi:hypothetical protein
MSSSGSVAILRLRSVRSSYLVSISSFNFIFSCSRVLSRGFWLGSWSSGAGSSQAVEREGSFLYLIFLKS